LAIQKKEFYKFSQKFNLIILKFKVKNINIHVFIFFSVDAVESVENEGAAEPEGTIQEMLQVSDCSDMELTEGKLGITQLVLLLETNVFDILNKTISYTELGFSKCYLLSDCCFQ
jgi:hypothetical protein